MDFAPSTRSAELTATLRTFIDEEVVPEQAAYDEAVAAAPDEQPSAAS